MTSERERRIQRGYAFALTPATTQPGERCPACRRKNRTGVVGCPTANNCERGDVVAPMRRTLTSLARARALLEEARNYVEAETRDSGDEARGFKAALCSRDRSIPAREEREGDELLARIDAFLKEAT